jgi:putative nucleotidyltransferase with HDIG domain
MDIQIPVCPLAFMRLASALESPDESHTDLASTISTDPALTLAVLRAANSAAYSLPRKVGSIEEAIFRIGYEEIWTIATGIKGRELFKNGGSGWDAFSQRLWTHSISVAVLSKYICRWTHNKDVESVFTIGMLHDLGKMILQQVNPQYTLLAQNGALRGVELVAREIDFFGTHHAALAGEMLASWQMPAPLVSVVARHHDEINDDELMHQRLVLRIANEMAHIIYEPGTLGAGVDETVLRLAKLDEDVCWQLAAAAQRQIDVLLR